MKILFIGTYIPDNKLKEFNGISTFLDIPGIILQNNLHAGLLRHAEIKSVVIPVLRTSFSNRNIGGYRFEWNGTSDNFSIPYMNIVGIKELMTASGAIKHIHEKQYHPDVVFVYSLGTVPYFIATSLKKHAPKVKLVSVITDLPQFMNTSKNVLYRTMKKIDGNIVRELSKKFDGFVLLSPYMREELPISDKPWIQIEGIYDMNDESKLSVGLPKVKSLFYGGALEERYGIVDLVKAFEKSKLKDYQLRLCGTGGAVGVIKEYVQRCPRIKYLGVIPHEEVLKEQRKASLLINPRKSSEEFTKYSFPSKTMEYLASGTPTLMSHLKSIPSDYDEHLFYFSDETVEGMRQAMEECLSIPSEKLEEKGKKAREFIINNKTTQLQVLKIFRFIESL